MFSGSIFFDQQLKLRQKQQFFWKKCFSICRRRRRRRRWRCWHSHSNCRPILYLYLCISIRILWLIRLNAIKFTYNYIFLNGPTPASFHLFFGLFRKTIQFCTESTIRCRDSNPQPLKHESSPLTIRPGTRPSYNYMLVWNILLWEVKSGNGDWKWWWTRFTEFLDLQKFCKIRFTKIIFLNWNNFHTTFTEMEICKCSHCSIQIMVPLAGLGDF